MTLESAHKYLKKVYLNTKNDSYREALPVVISASSPISREMVEMEGMEGMEDGKGNLRGL